MRFEQTRRQGGGVKQAQHKKAGKTEMKNIHVIDYKKYIGRYLRHYRQQAGLTAKQVAEHLGYASQQSIFNIESGKTPITTQKMFEFLAICGVDPDSAFTEPYDEVDNPGRKKMPGSMRLQELIDIFRDLGADNQRIILKVARALRDQQLQGFFESSPKASDSPYVPKRPDEPMERLHAQDTE